MRALVIASLAMLGLIAAGPATSPVVKVQLENPLSSEAKSFLDLDTGKTFDFSNYQRENFIRESGVDIMCETREPVGGFSTYALALITTNMTIDHPPPYRQMVDALAKLELVQFEMHSPKDFPAVYLFRTKGGVYGTLKIEHVVDGAAGLSLSYQILDRPRPVADSHRSTGEMPLGLFIQVLERQAVMARRWVPADHPALRAYEQELSILRQIADFEDACAGLRAMCCDSPQFARRVKAVRVKQQMITQEVNRKLLAITRPAQLQQAIRLRKEELVKLRKTYGEEHPLVVKIEKQIQLLDRGIRQVPATTQATDHAK